VTWTQADLGRRKIAKEKKTNKQTNKKNQRKEKKGTKNETSSQGLNRKKEETEAKADN
jgi:hypothetical protein